MVRGDQDFSCAAGGCALDIAPPFPGCRLTPRQKSSIHPEDHRRFFRLHQPPAMPSKAKSKPTKAAKKPSKPVAKKSAAKKPAPAKAKPAVKKPAAKKPAPKKAAAKVQRPAKSAPRTSRPAPKSKAKAVEKKPAAVVKKKPVSSSSMNGSAASVRRTRGRDNTVKPGVNFRTPGRAVAPVEKWTPPPEIARSTFNKKQRHRLLELKDSLVDSMNGMAEDTLRARTEGSEASAFGMHQADAGSDAYDRDFALSLLSKEQDALFEIDEALKRLDGGTYGICEACQKPIPQARLEALPFARFTIECQADYERDVGPGGGRRPVRSLFGLMGDEDEEEEGEEKETVDKSDD